MLTGRTPIMPLLWIFAISLIIATILNLGLGFDLFVEPPEIPESTLFPDRLEAIQPFHAARWTYDAAATLFFVIGFGALALAAGGVASLGGRHRLADVFRASMLVSGILGVVAGLLYYGATKVTVDLAYCDCGYIDTELIGQFWALAVVQGATSWVSNGAIVFGALAAATLDDGPPGRRVAVLVDVDCLGRGDPLDPRLRAERADRHPGR